MDQLGEDLVHVLDALDIKYCIGLGEGAGADILCRFAVSNHATVDGENGGAISLSDGLVKKMPGPGAHPLPGHSARHN